MILHSKIVGEGDKIIVILHGLFGSGDNWKTYANKLVSQGFCIHLIDQRNHGRSFHTDEFNYELLVIDLKNYLDQNNINDCILMGHSMGGKTAMNFALKYSEYVSRLIVLDIAPKYYPVHHNKILEALTSLDLDQISTRKEADQKLTNYIDDSALKNFLLKNLYWVNRNKLAFRFNLLSLKKNISSIGEKVNDNNKFLGKTIFLRGEFSTYVEEKDNIEINMLFPESSIITIPKSNHWLHVDNPDHFFSTIMEFIQDK